MSWSVYVVRFSDGRDVPMDRAAVEKVLNQHTVEGTMESGAVDLLLESQCHNHVFVDLTDDEQSIAAISFQRPSGDEIWNVIHQILQATGAVLIAPEGEIVVSSPDALVGLPDPFDEYPYTVAGSRAEMPWG